MSIPKWVLESAQVISVVILFFTLAVLIYQVVENTRAIENATTSSILTEAIAAHRLLVENEDLVDIQLKYQEDPNSLTELEMARKFYLDRLWWRQWENIYFQHEMGKLNEGPWGGFKKLICMRRKKSLEIEQWKSHREYLSGSFVGFVEGCNPFYK